MKFKYLAPNEYNDLSSGFRWIESEYLGPHDFKIYVDRATQKIINVEFDHDGHPEIHNGSDTSPDHVYMVYLHCHNPNHIALMAMICNHEDHYAENQVEVVCEKYNMVYQRHEPPALDHTYDLRKCTIAENGVVTYPWWQMAITWESVVAQGKSHRSTIKERLRNDILSETQRAKGEYCCEIVDYVILNEVSKNHPWKICWPAINDVSLDNSVPIGIPPDDGPNPSRQLERTTQWGAVPHEPAYHIEGDDFVLDAICPTTPEEAAELQPWNELHDEHPTHSTMVALHNEAREMLHAAADEDTHITNDHVIEHMEKLQAARAESNPEPQ